MSAFAEAMRKRVRDARAALTAALAAGDVYAAAVAEDELDDALRLAHAHGVPTRDLTGDATTGGESPR
ncbi:hypothetical protein BLA24_12025 [Streptomyces cinnamoneus]|uniref:Uncharacterized protein n=1 Tax=Streptomyces cinnamoneus TaxID=53446 RepID=A0A2G1XKN7_STRCJ|nr:hypothetical protein [Streptomyces cinnamoneus]PHQ51803.1 hypothetical protein BLA24_12025 [Streptomyces cinnamoneus]PPT12049.1 hypothetical protein CYQ11_03265 [Streptomyces cinnamoneus]